VFALTFITVFSHLFAHQIDQFTARISGGFNLRVESNRSNPIPPDSVRRLPGVDAVSVITTSVGEFKAGPLTDNGFKFWPFTAMVDRTFVDRGPTALQRRDPRYATDKDAYEAVFANPELAIVSGFALQNGGGPPRHPMVVGDVFTMRDPQSGRARDIKVAAIAESGFGNPYIFVSPSTFQTVFGTQASENVLYVATHPGTSPDALAARLNGQFVPNGADASSFRTLVHQNLTQQEGFFHLMQGYLALGLVVGIAGLGVVMVRAVRERRREVGVLRSLGFSSVAVRRAFVAESSFVALEGIGTGVLLAIITSWRMIGSGSFGVGLAYSVPWAGLTLLIVATFIASLLATAAPAQQASHIRPAVALRIAD